MKSVKPLFFLFVIVILVVLVVQNMNVFMHEEAVKLNLYVWSCESQTIPLSVYFTAFFLVGLLPSYFWGMSQRYKAKKMKKIHIETIQKFEEEINVLKSLPITEETTPPIESKSV